LAADIKNVLRLIADITGTNMVIEPDVSGQVTVKVEQVPWDQVLDLILSMNDLGKDEVGNVIRIATRAKLRQEWKEQEEAIKAKQQLMEAVKDFGEITTEYLAINYAKPADIASKINEIKSGKGKISIDDRTSLVIYTDFQSRIEDAKTLIGRLDKPTPQVMIEARIVQLNRRASRDLGISWNFFLQHTSDDGSHRFSQDFLVNHPVTGDLFGFAFGQLTGQTIWNVDLVLSAIESSGEGRIVSAPRVLTMDNVQALIKQGTQIPYLVLSNDNVASTELQDAALELQVTPHITPDNRVRLEIMARKDQPDFANPVGVQAQVPIIKREIQTELLVDNGAVIVIGGIIEDSEERSTEGTPGLSSVPILGRLFKKEQVKIEKTELLIFISPKIVGTNI
jgi:type IV pilus assembly protein PilQ